MVMKKIKTFNTSRENENVYYNNNYRYYINISSIVFPLIVFFEFAIFFMVVND